MKTSGRLDPSRAWTSSSIGLAVAISLVSGSSVALGEEIPFADARIIIEVNSTDEDAGIQMFFDGEPWRKAQIISPDGGILEISGTGNLSKLGLTELFFESEEPSLEDLPLEEFLALFPEGEYQLRGETVEGDELVGSPTLTHDIPAGPEVVMPEEGSVADPDHTVISWGPVTEPDGIEIVGYQVSVAREAPHRSFVVDLPPETTSLLVSPDFLEPGTAYKVEVLAIEVSGNQTITESFFTTAEE
jgi:hypothetical protein